MVLQKALVKSSGYQPKSQERPEGGRGPAPHLCISTRVPKHKLGAKAEERERKGGAGLKC